jgi:uncharacterized membrane protein YbhN (UPF0104 family)
LTAAFLLLLALYVASHLNEFRELLRRPIPKGLVLGTALASLLSYVANAEIQRRAQQIHGVFVPFWENLSVNICASASNYFLPLKGAVGLRAVYLKKRFGMRLTDFFSMLVAVAAVTLCVSSVFALIGRAGAGAAGPGRGKAAGLVFLYFLLAALAGLAALCAGKLRLRPPGGLLGGLWESWGRWRASPRLLLDVVVLDIVYYHLWCLVMWQALAAFGVALSPFEAYFYTSLQIHALIINLTPAGLGVMEAVGVFAGGVLDFSPAEALLAQGLSRLAAVAALTLSGALGWLHLVALAGRGKAP